MRNSQATVFIAAMDAGMRRGLAVQLFLAGFAVTECADASKLLSAVAKCSPRAVILGSLGTDPLASVEIAQSIRQEHASLPLIFVAGESSEALAIAALKAGISDYFRVPWSVPELLASIRQHIGDADSKSATTANKVQIPHPKGLQLIGVSGAAAAARDFIRRVAPADSSIVITGESGTGKDLVAQLVHAHSPRRGRPFVAVNCAAIPDSLLESELFGHEKGAFTGAHARKEGQLELAHRGTVFLDEIGDMSPYAQAKLLRVLENKELRRLGGAEMTPIDVRFVAATNRDIDRLIAEEKFRCDLYYRLNVARIHLPPLRNRKEDIPILAEQFRHELNGRFGYSIDALPKDVLDALLAHDWPGNIRELRNVLEATYINATTARISFADLPEYVRARLEATKAIGQDERSRMIAALLSTNWNMTKAARQLHWSRMTLYRKTAKYNIERSGEPPRAVGSSNRNSRIPVTVL
jgi:DNA-binding NtrC family response regulator